jgi:predicted RND superfamily exporter protein
MQAFEGLARVVFHRPVLVVLTVLAVSGLLGFFSGQAVNEDGVAVDNELTAALATIDERFGQPQSVVQVVIRTDGRDVRSADAVRTVVAIREAVESSSVSESLIAPGLQPPIVSFLDGAVQALAFQGRDVADVTDAEVPVLVAAAAAQLPAEVAGLLSGLLGTGEPPTAGLMLLFLDTEGLDDAGVLERQRALADVIAQVPTPVGFSVDPFSFTLLLNAGDIGPEIGRLFGTALLIVLIVLGFVYWLRPEPGGRRLMVRRTAADVGLTLLVIVLAVVWMQGIGVLLGPDYLGLISYFSAQTQIVPILIIGLGVDFGIHLLARYRAEVGTLGDPEQALVRAMRTVGFTLLLCTAATVIGFLTNLASVVDFLATLGVLAAAGIFAAFVLTLTLLPALRVMLDRRGVRRGTLPIVALGSQRESTLPTVIGRTAWLAERAPVRTLVAAALLVAAGGYGFTQLDSEFELTDFVPQDEPLLDVFATLTSSFEGGFEETTQVLILLPEASVAQHDAVIESARRLGEVPGVATLGPTADARTIASVLATARARPELDEALAGLGLEPDGRLAAGSDVGAVYDLLIAQVPGATDVLARDGSGFVTRFDVRTTAGQGGAAALEQDLLRVLSGVREAGAEAIPTSAQIVQARIGDDIEDSQIVSLLIALGAAMLLLVGTFVATHRRPLIGVVTVLPVGLVLALTFGTMALTGIPLNPVTATLAALSIGIGVPFTIHVTSRFLEERSLLYDGQTAIRRTVAQTGGALAGSALTTAIGFGILVTSTLKPFEQLGYVIVYAIVYSLMAAVLVLPSMLVLWDRLDVARASARSRSLAPRR